MNNLFNSAIIANSPLEQFEVSPIVGLNAPIASLNLTLTNLGLYVTLVFVVFIGLQVIAMNTPTSNGLGVLLVPSRWGIGFESAYTSLQSQTKEQVGSSETVASEKYLPFLYSLFFFILFGNLFGNVPYSYAFFTSAVTAMGFSVMIFLGVTIIAVYRHGLHFLSYFVPAGTPGVLVPLLICIEIISYFARAFSLGIRLFANLVAGHALLNILGGMLYKIMTLGLLAGLASLLPLAIFIALVGLEIAVSFIQAYVFVTLTCSYLKDAEYLH